MDHQNASSQSTAGAGAASLPASNKPPRRAGPHTETRRRYAAIARAAPRTKRGTFLITPAELRTRYDIAARLLITGERVRTIAEALQISRRQCQRLLRDPDFNAYYDQYRAAQMAGVDRAIQGQIVELLPLVPIRLRQHILQDENKEVSLRACFDVLDRCGIKVEQLEKPASLLPAQLEALANAASAALFAKNARSAPTLLGSPDDAGADSQSARPEPQRGDTDGTQGAPQTPPRA